MPNYTPLIIYIVVAIIYAIYVFARANQPNGYVYGYTMDSAWWTVLWLILWGVILGWFCYNSQEAAAYWLLVLPWLVGISLLIFTIGLMFISAGASGLSSSNFALPNTRV